MVMATISSKDFNWYSRVPQVMGGDDPKVFKPSYFILAAPKPHEGSFESRFADLPAFGIWKEHAGSGDTLLEEFSNGWRGFTTGK